MDATPIIAIHNGLPDDVTPGAVNPNGSDGPVVSVASVVRVSPSSSFGIDGSGDIVPVHRQRKVSFHNPKENSSVVGGDVRRVRLDDEGMFHQMALDRQLFPHETPTTLFSDMLGCSESPSDLLILFFWGQRQSIDDGGLNACKAKIARLLVSDLLTRLYPLIPALGNKDFRSCLAVAKACRNQEKEGKTEGRDVELFLRDKLSWYAGQYEIGLEENDLNRSYDYLRVFKQDPPAFISELIREHLPARELFKQVVRDVTQLK